MFDKISAISSSGDENTPEMNMSILDRVRFALSEFPLKKYSPQNAFAGAQ